MDALLVPQMGFWGVSGIVGTFVGSDFIDNNTNTYTFSGESIGGPGRIVVSVLLSHDSAVARSVSSLTVGGNSATKSIQKNDASANYYSVEHWYVDITSGTTADIVVTANGACQQCIIFVHRLIGSVSAPRTAFDTTAHNPMSTTIDTLAGGYTIATIMDLTRTHTGTWTGLTENGSEVTGTETSAGIMASSASLGHDAPSTPLTVQATPSAGSSGFTLIVSTFDP